MQKLTFIFGVVLALTTAAFAQSSTAVNPEMQALGAKLMDEINSEISWRTRALAAEAKVKELQNQLTSTPTSPKK